MLEDDYGYKEYYIMSSIVQQLISSKYMKSNDIDCTDNYLNMIIANNAVNIPSLISKIDDVSIKSNELIIEDVTIRRPNRIENQIVSIPVLKLDNSSSYELHEYVNSVSAPVRVVGNISKPAEVIALHHQNLPIDSCYVLFSAIEPIQHIFLKHSVICSTAEYFQHLEVRRNVYIHINPRYILRNAPANIAIMKKM